MGKFKVSSPEQYCAMCCEALIRLRLDWFGLTQQEKLVVRHHMREGYKQRMWPITVSTNVTRELRKRKPYPKLGALATA